MTGSRLRTLLAVVLVLLGTSQALVALTDDSPGYSMFYGLFGVGIATVGVVALWLRWRSAAAST